MDKLLLAFKLSQYLQQWFNNNPKTKITSGNLSRSFDYHNGYIVINVDYINNPYCRYFKRDVFQKNAELLIRRLAEVAKDWMQINMLHQYHFKIRIKNQYGELQQQALLNIPI